MNKDVFYPSHLTNPLSMHYINVRWIHLPSIRIDHLFFWGINDMINKDLIVLNL
jgi:hypothetical protein